MKTVKITSGIYKGVKIATPGGNTHPMGERERIALFNMIGDKIEGAKVLDAYCGSGALGIEAVSRGADEVVFVEKSHTAMRVANSSCMKLAIPEEKVAFYRGTVEAFYEKFVLGFEYAMAIDPLMAMFLQTFPRKVDIILADPPYDDFDSDEVGRLATSYLKDDGILVLSHPNEAPEMDGLKLLKTHKYAEAHISVYAKK